MSQKPPDDEDPIFETIFEQVKNAFSETNVGPFDATNEDVLSGIRDSLKNLLHVTRPTVEPHVTVVEGGRSMNTPPTEGEKPNLFVAESTDDLEEDTPNVSVCVLQPEEVVNLPFFSKSSLSSGKIRLVDFEERQLIYQGRKPYCYRIHVQKGQMALHVDKALIAIMKAGQSIDVEAERIEVIATSPEVSLGEFKALSSL